MSEKIACFAKLTAQPGKRDELVAVLEKIFETVEGEAGTEVYALHTDNAEPETVWFYELYSDQSAFDAHGKSDGMAAMIGALGGLLAGRPQLNLAAPVRSKGLGA